MNVLLIANSYGVDATRYLHRIARADNVEINTVCLYIGGCSLSTHYRNMYSENKAYELYINGEKSGFFVSLKEALLNRAWDVITFQQASNFSFDYESYQPYLDSLLKYAKKICPEAKQYIHQTWCDSFDSERLENFGFSKNREMFFALEKAYNTALDNTDACDIIKSGELILSLYENGLSPVWRDHGHISLGIGRYAVGLLWYHKLTGNDICKNTFSDFDEPILEKEIEVIKKCITNIG